MGETCQTASGKEGMGSVATCSLPFAPGALFWGEEGTFQRAGGCPPPTPLAAKAQGAQQGVELGWPGSKPGCPLGLRMPRGWALGLRGVN